MITGVIEREKSVFDFREKLQRIGRNYMQDRQKQILKFLQEIEQYKTIERQCFTSNPNRRESDAEHS